MSTSGSRKAATVKALSDIQKAMAGPTAGVAVSSDG
jgi:hypothetical protein